MRINSAYQNMCLCLNRGLTHLWLIDICCAYSRLTVVIVGAIALIIKRVFKIRIYKTNNFV